MHPGGVGDHERITPIRLGVTRVQIGRPPHDQAGHVGDRHGPTGGNGNGELCDRARLVDHQRRGAVLEGTIQQPDEICLVVADRPGEQWIAVVVEDVSEVLLPPDIEADPHGHLIRGGHPCSFLSSRHGREGRPGCARRHPPYEPAIIRMSPSEVHAPDRAGGNTPQAVEATGGSEPCRHRSDFPSPQHGRSGLTKKVRWPALPRPPSGRLSGRRPGSGPAKPS